MLQGPHQVAKKSYKTGLLIYIPGTVVDKKKDKCMV
jgi:hypothetical protein